jgi:hypothetical protein
MKTFNTAILLSIAAVSAHASQLPEDDASFDLDNYLDSQQEDRLEDELLAAEE